MHIAETDSKPNQGSSANSTKIRRAACYLLLASCVGLVSLEILVRHSATPVWVNEIPTIIAANKARAEQCTSESILLLGDSSMNHAVDPILLEQLVGIPICVAALHGHGGLLNDYWMLRYALEKTKSLRAAIIMHRFEMWGHVMTNEYLSALMQQFHPWRLDAVAEDVFSYSAIAQKAKSFQMRFLEPRGGFRNDLPGVVRRVNFHREQQAVMAQRGYGPQGRQKNWANRQVQSKQHGFNPAPLQHKYLHRTLELGAEYQTPLYFVGAPIWRKLFQASLVKIGRQRKWLSDQLETSPLANVLDKAMPAIAEDDELGDTRWHLNASGRERYTRWFAQQLIEQRVGLPK